MCAAQNHEQPGALRSFGPEGGQAGQGAEKGVLHEFFGRFCVGNAAQGKAVELVAEAVGPLGRYGEGWSHAGRWLNKWGRATILRFAPCATAHRHGSGRCWQCRQGGRYLTGYWRSSSRRAHPAPGARPSPSIRPPSQWPARRVGPCRGPASLLPHRTRWWSSRCVASAAAAGRPANAGRWGDRRGRMSSEPEPEENGCSKVLISKGGVGALIGLQAVLGMISSTNRRS
jgi:hypothetical protein